MKQIRNRILTLLLALSLLIPLPVRANEEDYELKQVVVLSRHNIRAPLSTKGSALDSATPHTWYEWSSNASELSLRGGMLETAMGQYFRKWLESEGLIEENWRPEKDEVLFYANAKQRTIATAEYFAGGFLPVGGPEIVTKQEYDKMDPVFTPQITFVNEEFYKDASKEILENMPDLEEECDLLEEVLDFRDSDAYKDGSIKEITGKGIEIVLEKDKEPGSVGTLKTGVSLADALVLQYYEEEDLNKASFGHELSDEDWLKICEVKDGYIEAMFGSKLVSVNVANPLLKEIRKELNNEDRKFTFLCGHDSNLTSVLGALDVKEYRLPEALETKTPIGSKLVFERYEKGNEDYIKVDAIYNSLSQMRNISILDEDNPPMIYPLEFEGMEKNEDGMYRYEDLMDHLDKSIQAYDEMVRKYDPKANIIPKTGIE